MSRALESLVYELERPRGLKVRRESLDLEKLSPDQIAARTRYSALSPGTEVAAYVGAPPLRPMQAYPRVVGYCNVAEVVAVGTGVVGCHPGDLVLTFQSHRSSFVCAETAIAARIPTGADLEEASTTYLFHLGYNALLKGQFQPGLTVGVVGLGTLGLAALALASGFGGEAFAFSNIDRRAALAQEFGAMHVFRKDAPEVGRAVREMTGGGLDLVVSTASSWEDWRLALQVARKEGTICVLGFPGRGLPAAEFNPLDSQYFYDRQLRIVSCGYTPQLDVPPHDIRFTIQRNCRFLLGRVLRKQLPARRLISSVVPWQELGAVYEAMVARDPGLITSVLRWE